MPEKNVVPVAGVWERELRLSGASNYQWRVALTEKDGCYVKNRPWKPVGEVLQTRDSALAYWEAHGPEMISEYETMFQDEPIELESKDSEYKHYNRW